MPNLFGTGPGHLPAQASEIAKKYGASLINDTDTQCSCGHGCRPYRCEESRRHWFSAPNEGHPFDTATRIAVENDLRAAKLIGPEED